MATNATDTADTPLTLGQRSPSGRPPTTRPTCRQGMTPPPGRDQQVAGHHPGRGLLDDRDVGADRRLLAVGAAG